MVEKMTAVWLIILTLIVCAAVPSILIYVTTIPAAKMLSGLQMTEIVAQMIVLRQ